MTRFLFLIVLFFPNLLLGARGATSSPGGIIGAIGVILGLYFIFIMIADKSGGKENYKQNIKIKKEPPNVAEIKNYKVKGTTKFSNGDRYIGEWKNNKMHGKGTYIFKSGSKYIGQWKNDNHHGNGEYISANGSIAKGTWKNHQLHGKGTINFSNGDDYIGEFSNGNFEGRGTYTYADGTIKKGIWKKDKLFKLDKEMDM